MSEKSLTPAKLKWACRRGMLELDLILNPFLNNAYATLTLEQQLAFERLLRCEDQDLFAWFINYEIADDAELAALVTYILDHVRTPPAIK